MTTSKNTVCPGCTLLCDDVEIINPGPQSIATHACRVGEKYFRVVADTHRAHSVSGQRVTLDAAIQAASKTLVHSKSPLICGLDQLTTEAQQTAWKLADKLGATIDTTFSNAGRASMFALQRVGKVTATIGEIANRSDLVVFWFCDPETTHPRLLQRLNHSTDHPNRRVIVVDQNKTKTAMLADLFIQIDPDFCPATLATLRAVLSQTRIRETQIRESTGLERQAIEEFATLLREASYGSIFYGQTTQESAFDLATDSIHQLIRQLNNVTRFVGIKLRNDGNSQSAENVLAWSTGYPFAVNHHLKHPRFNWLEHSAETTLNRARCDAILFATGSDTEKTFASLSQVAKIHLQSIPRITLSPSADFPSDVAIQVGIPGLNEAGEFCRIDDVSLPISKTLSTNEPSAAEILDRIYRGC